MGFLNSGISNVVGQGYGLAKNTGLLAELTGEPTKVQFVRSGIGTVFQFDACLNESHQREAVPTAFPLEDGGVISDHIIVAPVELTLTGVVADFPLYDSKKLISQALGAAVTGVLPPLGITLGAAAQKVYSLTHQALLPSKEAYKTLIEMQAGNPNASPPVLPEPFTVMTYYARYPNMVIKSLQFPRDSTTSSLCVFTITLAQLRRVKPQAVNVSILKNPGLASQRADLGETEAEGQSAFKDGFQTEQKNKNDAIAGVKSSLGKLGIGG